MAEGPSSETHYCPSCCGNWSGASTGALRKQMARCAPAYYLNKGADITRDRLAARIRDIFGRVFAGGGAPIRPT
jgi:Zn-finger nucleic acid-binding protein